VHAVRQTRPLTRAYEHGGVIRARARAYAALVRARVLVRVVPGVAVRSRVSRTVNTTHHARHVPRRENVRTLRACNRGFTRERAHGRRMNESRET